MSSTRASMSEPRAKRAKNDTIQPQPRRSRRLATKKSPRKVKSSCRNVTPSSASDAEGSSAVTISILQLPREMLYHIVCHGRLSPRDVLSLSSTCKELYEQRYQLLRQMHLIMRRSLLFPFPENDPRISDLRELILHGVFTPEDILSHENFLLFLACRDNDLDVVKWISEELGLTTSTAGRRSAHFEDLKEQMTFVCDPFSVACENGRLDIIKYLHKTVGLTAEVLRQQEPDVFENACIHAEDDENDTSLPVFKYLYEEMKMTADDIIDDEFGLVPTEATTRCSVFSYLFDTFELRTRLTSKQQKLRLLVKAWEMASYDTADYMVANFSLSKEDVSEAIEAVLLEHEPFGLDWSLSVLRRGQPDNRHLVLYDETYHEFFVEMLSDACQAGRLDVARLLFQDVGLTFESSEPDVEDLSFLGTACEHGFVDIVKFLFETPTGLDDLDLRSAACLVLQSLCEKRQINVLRFLFEDVQLTTEELIEEDCHLLAGAYTDDHIDVVKYSVSALSLDVDEMMELGLPCLLGLACIEGHLGMLKFCCEELGVSADDLRRQNIALLTDAGGNGHLHILRYLVESVGLDGSDVAMDEFNMLGSTAAGGSAGTLQYLVQLADRSVDAVAEDHLSIACLHGRLDVVEYLVGTARKISDQVLADGLKAACSRGYIDVVKYLCTQAKVPAITYDGLDRQPMVLACKHGHLSVARFLMENILQPTQWSERGHLAALKAAIVPRPPTKEDINGEVSDRRGTVRYMCQHATLTVLGMRTVQTGDDCSLLARVCGLGWLDAVKALCERVGFSAQDIRADGCNALARACSQNRIAVVKYLFERVGLTVDDVRAHGGIVEDITKQGNTQLLRYLVGSVGLQRQDLFPAVLLSACQSDRGNVVLFLLDEGGMTLEDVRANDHEALKQACHGTTTLTGRVLHFLFAFGGLTAKDALVKATHQGNMTVFEHLCRCKDLYVVGRLFEFEGLDPEDVRHLSTVQNMLRGSRFRGFSEELADYIRSKLR